MPERPHVRSDSRDLARCFRCRYHAAPHANRFSWPDTTQASASRNATSRHATNGTTRASTAVTTGTPPHVPVSTLGEQDECCTALHCLSAWLVAVSCAASARFVWCFPRTDSLRPSGCCVLVAYWWRDRFSAYVGGHMYVSAPPRSRHHSPNGQQTNALDSSYTTPGASTLPGRPSLPDVPGSPGTGLAWEHARRTAVSRPASHGRHTPSPSRLRPQLVRRLCCDPGAVHELSVGRILCLPKLDASVGICWHCAWRLAGLVSAAPGLEVSLRAHARTAAVVQ
jgi:hypothetical protein